jgi:NADPH-ferrihemoprotein reductase
LEHNRTYRPQLTVVEEPGHGMPATLPNIPSTTSTACCSAPIMHSYALSKGIDRSYIHVDLNIKGTSLHYETGDHLGLATINPEAEVTAFLKTFNLWPKRNTVISIRMSSEDATTPIPSPTTYADAARYCLDICGPVSRQTLMMLADCTSESDKKDLLNELGRNKDLFAEKTRGMYFNLASLIAFLFPDSPTLSVPFAAVVEGIQRLQLRFYSISSSSTLDNGHVALTVAVESFRIPETARQYNGVATNYLVTLASQLKVNPLTLNSRSAQIDYNSQGNNPEQPITVPVFVRPSTFRLPSDPTVPILMIGPGTGVAPFRGFVRERLALKRQSSTGLGTMTLLYGCRTPEDDFLYREEWDECAKELGRSFKMYTAFSRQSKHKVYVQNILLERAAEFAAMIDNGCHIYVCGDVRMGQDVYKTLCNIICSETRHTKEQAEEFMSQLRKNHRYHVSKR